jgi:hypothetical protein
MLASVAVACSAESVTPATVDGSDAATLPDDDDTTDAGTTKPGKDASTTEPKVDAAEPVPTKPFFDVTVNGTAMKVKNVTVKPTNVYPSQGVSYYEIEATLERTPPLTSGLQDDPSIVIRVAKDENGSDVCKEKRGPAEGFVEPVIELREVQIHYRHFNGSSTVTAFPSTPKSGSCTMLLKSAATNGQAWGEATGMLQSGASEPAFNFQAKWFQTFKWQ